MNEQGLKQWAVKLAIWMFRAVLAMIIIIVAGIITELVAVPIAEQISMVAPWVSALIMGMAG